METKKYSLNDLIKIIWKNIIVIIVFAVIGGSGFFILAKHKQSTTYTAERSMMISHSLDSKRAHSQVSADLAMIPTYEDLIKSCQVTESTWKALPKSIRKETSPKSISDNIDTNNRPESLVITVKATTKDANQSLAIANTTVEVAKKELPKMQKELGTVHVYTKANRKSVTSQTHGSVKKYTLVGVALGIVAGMLVSFTITTLRHMN